MGFKMETNEDRHVITMRISEELWSAQGKTMGSHGGGGAIIAPTQTTRKTTKIRKPKNKKIKFE
jgi:hypothetical protein